jgi:hypothetical protein
VTADYARTRIEEAVDQALTAAAPIGEVWYYDIAPSAVDMGAGYVVAYALIITARNVLLSPRWIAMSEIIIDSFPPDEMIKGAVTKCVQQLLEVRETLLQGKDQES